MREARYGPHVDERSSTDPVTAMLAVDPAADAAPFEQLRQQLAAAAADGRLPAGTRLPPVRALAGSLGLAAGTVARTYRELEADGVVRTQGRRGTLVAGTADDDSDARAAAAAYVAVARRQGLTRAQALLLVEEGWAEPGAGAGGAAGWPP